MRSGWRALGLACAFCESSFCEYVHTFSIVVVFIETLTYRLSLISVNVVFVNVTAVTVAKRSVAELSEVEPC